MNLIADGKRVQFNPVRSCFVLCSKKWDDKDCVLRVHEDVFPGITRVLSSTFWPNYKYDESVNKYAKRPRAAQRGMARGIRLDNELKLCTKWVQDHPELSMSDFLCPALLQPSVLSAEQIQCFKRMRKTLHVSTLRVINFLNKHDLVLYQSQLPIASFYLHLATSVDLVCQHKDDRGEGRPVVLVEIKSGGLGYYNKSNGNMKYPYQNVTNSPEHQHQLQLTLTRWIYQEDYQRVHGRPPVIRKAFVLRTDTQQTTMYEQQAWTGYSTEEYKSLMYEAILLRR
jgi:hypothetical protein